MRLPAGRYRTPLSRASTARRKREPPRREVPEFKRRSRAESGARDPDFTRTENGGAISFFKHFSWRIVASVLRIVRSREEFSYLVLLLNFTIV